MKRSLKLCGGAAIFALIPPMSRRLSIAVFAVLLASASLRGAEDILVASSRSNSIEQFSASGTWIRTFATTGPYSPTSLAQSPLTGEIFVTTAVAGTLTNVILRYQADGQFNANWDTFTVVCGIPSCPTSNQTESILFDAAGNLWVATAYGTDASSPIYIFKYLAANLALTNPPTPLPTVTTAMFRGNQMAFHGPLHLCIAGFIDANVRCFSTSTGAQTHDYHAEIAAAGLSIEPGGLAFDSTGRMYLSSIFTGQVVKEVNPGGPIVLLASVVSSPQLLNANLTLRGTSLYVPTYYNPPPTISTPDPVYEVAISSGTITNFIFGTAPPALGNDHIWGGSWLIFYSTTL